MEINGKNRQRQRQRKGIEEENKRTIRTRKDKK
jgi:hypothetical protein